jgi:hypothetical protein
VVGELRQVCAGDASVDVGQGVNREPVETHTARGGDPVIQRVADEHVREPHLVVGPGNVGEHARPHRLVELLEQVVVRDGREPCERSGRELATQHRCEQEDAVAPVGEVCETTGDHVPDALGDVEMSVR